MSKNKKQHSKRFFKIQMKKLSLLFLFLLIIHPLTADEQRITTFFESENKEFSLELKKGKWNLSNDKGKKLYSFKNKNYESQSIFISNDGEKIVVINDYMEGHIISDRIALSFYNKGKLQKEYRLTELVTDTTNIDRTIWHTIWCIEDFGFQKNDSLFSIATFEFREFLFDTSNGKIISNKRPEPFDDSALIVRGEFFVRDSSETTMCIKKYIYGQSLDNDKIRFTTNQFGKGRWFTTLMIKDGVDVTPIRFNYSAIIY